MASSLSHAMFRLQDGICCSSLASSVPRHVQFCIHKEILGTPILSQSSQFLDVHCKSQQRQQCQKQHQRRLTIEAAKRVDNNRSFILSTTLKAQEDQVDKVAKFCEDIRVWALEKKKDKSVGLKQFECYVDLYEKNVFHFMEEYASFIQMNDFRATPEHVKFCNDVRPLLLEPIALAAYEYRDGQLGDMLNPIGPKGEGGLDDATGQAGRGGEAYMKPKEKKRRGIEFEKGTKFAHLVNKNDAKEEATEKNNWSFEKILAKVLGQNSESSTEDEERWSLKSIFSKRK